MGIMKFSSLSKFDGDNTVWWVIFTVLSVHYISRAYLLVASLYPKSNIGPIPHPTVPGDHRFTLCLYECGFFQIPQISEILQDLSFSDLLHVAYALKSHPGCCK